MLSKRCVFLLACLSTPLAAQAIPTGRPRSAGEVARTEYLRFLPLLPNFGVAAEGSRRFRLYGEYADPYEAALSRTGAATPVVLHRTSRVPSLDSARAERLHALAVRFRPLMRRNSNSTPRAIHDLLGLTYSPAGDSLVCSGSTLLHHDLWSTSGVAPVLAERRTIDLGISELRRCPRGPPIAPLPMSPAADLAYQEVLFGGIEGDIPDRIKARQQVLFFDLPGRNTGEWARTRVHLESLPPAVYAHLFLDRVSPADTPDSLQTYDPIVQYWFYFPGNDSGNDHEGDWEHINVHITTRARAASGQPSHWFPSVAELDAMLDPEVPLGDSLIISAVDYYFHHYVAVLDYKPVYARTAPEPTGGAVTDADRELLARFGHRDEHGTVPVSRRVYRAIERRISAAEGRFETHPIGYIGGSTMSVIAAFRRPARARDQNSHGIYPFPGMWHGIGPMGAVEMVRGRDPSDSTLASEFIDFAPEEIRLIPDWEPLWQLLHRDASVRQRWGWLVLPVRWGFPVFESPLMRQIERYDFGGVAPIGPVYNPAWNRFGPGQNFHLYRIRTVSGAFQRSLLDIGHPSLGFVNLPLLLFTKAPPFNGIASHLMLGPAAAGLGPGNFEQQGGALLTHRYSAGIVHPLGGTLRLHRRVADSLAVARAAPGAATLTDRTVTTTHGHGAYVAYEVPVGRKYVATATLIFPVTRSFLRYTYAQPEGGPIVVDGSTEPWELSGDFGRRLPTIMHRVESRIRLGYGWTWYRYRPMSDDSVLTGPTVKGGRNPLTFWAPNSLSMGITADIGLFNARRNLAEAGLLQLGLRVGATAVHTRRSGFRGLGQVGLTATW